MKRVLLMLAAAGLLLCLTGCYLPLATTTTIVAATNFPSGTTDTFTAYVNVDLQDYRGTLAPAVTSIYNPQPKVCFYQEGYSELLLGCVPLGDSNRSGNIGVAKLTTSKLVKKPGTSYVVAYFSDPTGFFASSFSQRGAPIWY